MKTSSDPRHQQRITIVKELFAQSFHAQSTQQEQTLAVVKHKDHIDSLIAKAAPEWPLEKVGKVDLAILRLAVYELLIDKKEPPKVVIDEAVEIAKEFGGESSAPFVNGVLGTVLKLHDEPKKP